MSRSIHAALVATVLLCAASLTSLAADQDRIQTQDQDRIYGSQLMSERERDQYREKMRTAKSEQERQKVRAEHHERMKVRAQERGVAMPDDPPTNRGHAGTGPGMGPGPGMGGGSGGSGGGRGGR